jgi:hypothetical protein
MNVVHKGYKIEITSRQESGAWSAQAQILSEKTGAADLGFYTGGRYGAALWIPLILHQRAEGVLQLDGGEIRQHNDRSGLGDIYVSPIQLN